MLSHVSPCAVQFDPVVQSQGDTATATHDLYKNKKGHSSPFVPLFFTVMKTAVLLSTFVVLWDLVAAVHFPIVGKRQNRHLERRSTVSGSAALTDSNDVQYSANITLGGLQFSVLIDTGR
jgi:hypothetical protein